MWQVVGIVLGGLALLACVAFAWFAVFILDGAGSDDIKEDTDE